MAALTDTQLAQLAIAATAVPPSQREQRLSDLPERIDPLRRRLALARARKDGHRVHERKGKRVF